MNHIQYYQRIDPIEIAKWAFTGTMIIVILATCLIGCQDEDRHEVKFPISHMKQ